MKGLDKAALMLIVLAAISKLGPPLIRYVETSSPLAHTIANCTIFFIALGSAVSLTLSIGIGIWLLRQAETDGRSPWIWFLFGFVFTLTAIIVYLLLPILEEKRKQTGEQEA